jgi:DNA-binding CsgD family transcriptional regulator
MIATNQPDRARRALDQVRELAEDAPALRGAVPWLSGWFGQVSGDLRAARIAFESGLARPVGANDRLMHRARLEQAYGHLLLAMHDRRGAITSLTQAHRRFAAIGARPFLERCAADLNACGLELDTPSRLDLLTEREREVVYLVARGLTNRQAAAQLYVTEKTVEYHLGNVYAKLGIASRRQLRTHPVLRGMAS